MTRHGILVLLIGGCLALFPLLQCGFGEIISEGEEGCPYGCPEGMVCVERACVDPDTGCEGVICQQGSSCVAGFCLPDDACEGVVCDPGYTCQYGNCIFGEVDGDGDGFTVAEDCDDIQPSIYPGAYETCDGVDQDCDGDIDEGYDTDLDGFTICGGGDNAFVDCDDEDPNVYPGAVESCNGADDDCDSSVDEGIEARPCSTACGDGEETCVEGAWVCDASENCDCQPPETDTRDCGSCGTETRSCNADGTWGSWGGCDGEGSCTPGAVDNRECGTCGTQSRTCGGDCQWGSWGGCVGGGDCDPGAIDTGATCQSCSHRVCDDQCRWGPCVLRPTSACEWNEGTHWRCCASGRWQFCLSSCQWSTDCASCTGCGC